MHKHTPIKTFKWEEKKNGHNIQWHVTLSQVLGYMKWDEKKIRKHEKNCRPANTGQLTREGGQQVRIPDRFGKRGWGKWTNSSSINRYNWGSCSTGHLTPRCYSGVVKQPAGGSNSQMPEEVGQRVSGKQGKNKSASQLYLDQKKLNAWGFSGRLPNKSGFGMKSWTKLIFNSIHFI